MSAAAALVYVPRPVSVVAAESGRPQAVEGTPVDAIREEWLVEDRWWSAEPIRRRYFELVLTDGRCVVVFSERGSWYGQRA